MFFVRFRLLIAFNSVSDFRVSFFSISFASFCAFLSFFFQRDERAVIILAGLKKGLYGA